MHLLQHLVSLHKKNSMTLLAGVTLFFGIGFFLLPTTQYKVGNIFFGSVPSLYNVNLSQYFYLYAAHPPIGAAPEFAHYQLSRTYFIQGELEAALDEANAEIALYPENTRTYYILGLTYGYLNNEHAAIEAFGKFVESNPYSWAARNDKAWLQFRVGDVSGALETIEPVAFLLNPWVQNTYGTLLLNEGRYAEAREAFLSAQYAASEMSAESWGSAYPGNDPRVYDIGLAAMRESIKNNLALIEKQESVVHN